MITGCKQSDRMSVAGQLDYGIIQATSNKLKRMDRIMTTQEIDRWNAIADDTENNERIDRELCDMAKRNLVVQHKAALIETFCRMSVIESDE